MLCGVEGYDEDLAYMQSMLNSLQAALRHIKQDGQLPGQWSVEDIRTRMRTLIGKLDAMRREVSGRDMPSQFMLKLSDFSDQAIKFQGDIARSVDKVVVGVGNTINIMPLVLSGLVIAVIVGFAKGSLGVKV